MGRTSRKVVERWGNRFGDLRREEGVVDTGDRLLTPGEVAALFRVDPKTVTRWAAAGRISSIRTPGGHRRFRESEVRALLEGEGELDEPRQAGPGNNGHGQQ
jgi:excisionase family DNA binding protein